MTSFWRRQRMLIDRLQLRLMAINVLYLAVLSLVFATAMFGPHVYTLYSRGASPEAKGRAAESLLLLHSTVWPPLIVVALVFFYHSMVYSHRIAGPLYRFRKVFEQVATGDLRTRAVIRTADYLHREADALNEMVEAVAGKIERVGGALDAIQRTALELRSACRDGANDATSAALDRLESRLAAARQELDGFGLPSTGRRGRTAPTLEPAPTTEDAPVAHV